MQFLKSVISLQAPAVRDALWIKPVDGGFVLYVLSGGKWKPLKLVDDNATPATKDDKVKTTPKVTDITKLTNKQCNALNVGDHVIKITGSQSHLYTVTYKDETGGGMCLTYMDAENVETVAYDRVGNVWSFTDKTVTPIA